MPSFSEYGSTEALLAAFDPASPRHLFRAWLAHLSTSRWRTGQMPLERHFLVNGLLGEELDAEAARMNVAVYFNPTGRWIAILDLDTGLWQMRHAG